MLSNALQPSSAPAIIRCVFLLIFCLTLVAQDTSSKPQAQHNAQSAQPLSADFVKAARRAKNAIDNIPCTASTCPEVQKYLDDASVEASTKPEKVTMTIIETYQLKTATLYIKAGMNPHNPHLPQLQAELKRCGVAIDAMLKAVQYDESVAAGCEAENDQK